MDFYYSMEIIASTDCKTFMEKFTEIAESQQVGKNSTEGDEAAGLLENISVEDKKSEEKALVRKRKKQRRRRKNKKKKMST